MLCYTCLIYKCISWLTHIFLKVHWSQQLQNIGETNRYYHTNKLYIETIRTTFLYEMESISILEVIPEDILIAITCKVATYSIVDLLN